MDTPKIFGIVNITEDSFSDGGLFLETRQALEQARRLRARGAHVIDLGAASSNPAARPVPPQTEMDRLAPVIHELHREGIPVSVDTFHPEVQRFCLGQGVDYLNDIQGFPHPEIYEDLARSRVGLIVMHSIQGEGIATVEEAESGEDLRERIASFFHRRIALLTAAGIHRDRIILDPGMGFFLGSNPAASLSVLRRIPQLKAEFGLPILVSVSRKSFLGNITGRPTGERGAATLAAELYAARLGVDGIRTHDAGALRDGLLVDRALEHAP